LIGTRALVAGGNTGGDSCFSGGTGNGPTVFRNFVFSEIDISTSGYFTRTLRFNFGTRQPTCNGTGWDSGENLIFTPVLNGITQQSITVATGVNQLLQGQPQCVKELLLYTAPN